MPAPYDKERRESPRQIINDEAVLFIPVENMRLPCVVVNMSATGAKVTCDAIPPSGTEVVLFLKGGLSIKAVTTRYETVTTGEGELGLRFNSPVVE